MIYSLDLLHANELVEVLRSRGLPMPLAFESAPEARLESYEIFLDSIISALQLHEQVRPLSSEVFVCLLESADINAHVMRHNGRYYLTMNAGVQDHLTSIMCGFASYPQVQELLLGHVIYEPRRFEAISIPHLMQKFRTADYSDVPNEIAQIAIFMSDVACNFLTYHEYAHLIAGHLDCMHPEDLNFFCMAETPARIDDLDRALSLRTIEHDADTFGAIQGFSTFQKTRRWELAFPNTHRFAKERLGYIAISALFLALERSGSDRLPEERRSHPIAANRSQFALGALMEATCQATGMSTEEYYREINGPSLQAFFDPVVQSCPKSRRYIRQVSDYHSTLEHSRIERRWALLRPMLETHKLAPTLRLAIAQAEPG